MVGGDDVTEPARSKPLDQRCGRKAPFEAQRILSRLPAPLNATDARIEAERAFAEISTPSHVLPNLAAAWQRDHEARIRLNKPLIDHARARWVPTKTKTKFRKDTPGLGPTERRKRVGLASAPAN
jgi:hypothetical protein